eukprot:5046636-Amphidinium_carterae.1
MPEAHGSLRRRLRCPPHPQQCLAYGDYDFLSEQVPFSCVEAHLRSDSGRRETPPRLILPSSALACAVGSRLDPPRSNEHQAAQLQRQHSGDVWHCPVGCRGHMTVVANRFGLPSAEACAPS